ncbi:MAG: YbaB/EbfC family nucleoid-associated protein [Clostridia bacterium]|nr:YbaB/EbfC family nucleoid-associated protein [Clostridia bacterium]
MARGGFPGIPGGNMQQLMRQAQKMQQQMMEMQQNLDAREYEGTAGGGAVSCRVSGKRELLELHIDRDAVDPEEVEMLQDMIVAAVNDALKKGEETREAEMAKLGGAAGMGGLF